MVGRNGYAIKIGGGKGISGNVPLICTICASVIVESTSGELFFESPTVGLLGSIDCSA